MALIRWQPFHEVDSLQRDMNRLFDRFITNNNEDNVTSTFAPAAEIKDMPDAIHLKLEIPGIEPKDIDVQVSAEAVSISGERQEETKTQDKGMTPGALRKS